jgi:hypothetical protein
MKYAVEVGSGTMIHISSFINTGSAIQKLKGDRQTHREQGDGITLVLFFQSKEGSATIWKV